MLKKLWILPLMLLVFLIPMVSAQAAAKPEITNVRTATRTDANTPFVRTVLDVSGKANPKLYIDNSGEYVFVTLPNTGIGKNVAKSYKPNSNVISRVTLSSRSSSTDVTIKVPRAVTKNDVKVFTLPGATGSKVSSRVVIDINDKSGKLKQWSHWGDTNIGIKGATKPSQSWKPSSTKQPATNVPAYSSSKTYSLTKGLQGKTIAIDPGHGGSDSGAVRNRIPRKRTLPWPFPRKSASPASSAAGANVIMTPPRLTSMSTHRMMALSKNCRPAATSPMQPKADVFRLHPHRFLRFSVSRRRHGLLQQQDPV